MNRFHPGVVRRMAGSALVAAAIVLPGVFPRPAAAVEPSLGSVTIVQSNPANPSQAFHYTSNVPEMTSDFYLDQDPTTFPDWSETSNWVTPGEYVVSQDEPPLGWDIGDISCTDPDGNSSGEIGNRTARIRMDADEEIVCTFTMGQSVGDINIYQSTVPQGSTSFQYAGDLGSFSLADDGDEVNDGTWRNQGFGGVWEGTYEVTQSALDGWDLTYLDCIDPDGGTNVDLAARTVTIDLDGGETIDCTFTNQQPAVLTGDVNIDLQTVPETGIDVGFSGDLGSFALDDDGDTDLTLPSGMSFPLLSPGTKLVDIEPPVGWVITDRVCVDPDAGTTVDVQRFTIDLDAGETVNCVVQIEPAPPAPRPTCNGLAATIVGKPGATTIRGTQGPDVIVDLDGDNRIDGRGGYDTICTGNGNDVISGGAGDDVILAGSGANNVDGGAGNDVISGLAGDDNLAGGTGNDWIYANEGNNTVSGGGGDDHIAAGTGNDRIDGGKNFDTYVPGGGTDVVRNCEA